jgi:8-oxo-dGTP pyrophosphatase MutT (NUDIX family)
VLDCSGDNPWQRRHSRVVFDNGHLRLREDQVIQPDGAPGTYTYVELPHPVVAIVPVGDDGLVHLVRQWRYPWGRNSWEIPAGHCEPDEAPLVAAQRELAEEVGVRAERWRELGRGFPSAIMAAPMHLYLAQGLAPVREPLAREGAEGDLISRAVPLAAAVEAVLDGTIVHAYTAIGLLRAARLFGI